MSNFKEIRSKISNGFGTKVIDQKPLRKKVAGSLSNTNIRIVKN